MNPRRCMRPPGCRNLAFGNWRESGKMLHRLFSIYNCPATNITAANAIANIAVAGGLRSFSAGGLRLHKQKTALRSRGDLEGRLESIAVHDDALALLNRTSGKLFRGRRSTPSVFP